MKSQTFRHFDPSENSTWSILYANLAHCREGQAAEIFNEGVRALQLDHDKVPDIGAVNARLQQLTGWKGVPVEGLEDNPSFFKGMSEKKFPIGNFIRSAQDVNYTPAPDVFHDLYGHLPFLANKQFADFCQDLGARAAKMASSGKAMELWGRLFWFGVEFSLVRTPKGPRIFGGGILSSYGESNYALSDKPEVLPFDLERIIASSYKIDEYQKQIYILNSPEQLYSCLPEAEKVIQRHLESSKHADSRSP